MMNTEKTSISPQLFLPLMIVVTLGYGLTNLPSRAAEVMGPIGYQGLFIAAIFALPGLAAVYGLSLRYPSQSIIQYSLSILGSFFGRVMTSIYIFFFLALFSVFTRDLLNLTTVFLLDSSPLVLIVLIFLIPVTYLASRGIETISRLASFVFIPGLLMMVVLLLFGLRNISITHLQPWIPSNFFTYFKGGYSLSYSFFLLGTTAMILPYLSKKQAFPRYTGLIIGVLLLLFVPFTIGAIGTFSPIHMQRFAWPALSFIRTIKMPFFIIEEAGLIMLIDWFALLFVGAGYGIFLVSLGVSQWFRKWNYKKVLWIISPVFIILTLVPADEVKTKWLFGIISNIGYPILYGYPMLLLIVDIIFHRKRYTDA